jgi:hypothetical protein
MGVGKAGGVSNPASSGRGAGGYTAFVQLSHEIKTALDSAAMQDHLLTLLDQNPGRHQSKTVGRTRNENLGHV